jgi:glycine/D-amino acid oxidase-like deaminating enzyme
MKKNFFILSLLSLALLFNLPAYAEIQSESKIPNTREIRKIVPPKLDKAHLGKHILCHRPMREGSPEMNVVKSNNKIIANNYGHGGSGWTLGPGAANYVVSLLETEMAASKLGKNEPITVIGGGALGLFSATELVEKGYKNITVMAASFDDLTSHNAGGLLAPVSMDNEPEMQKLIDQIGIDAYKFYKEIALKQHKHFKEGAIIVPTYFEDRQDSGLEPYVGKVMQPAKDVVLDFGTGVTRAMVSYDDGIFMDTGKLMDLLYKNLEGKVKFVTKKVENFAEVEDKVIVNCTGNGAKELAKDEKMVSVQGHLIMLENQEPKDINHMILVYFGKNKTKSGFDVKRSFYIFPKRTLGSNARDVGVIGGTFIEGATASTPNEEEFDIMLQGAKDFYGIK